MKISRAFPKGLGAKVYEGTWEILPIFKLTEELGNVSRMSMYNTFNMGIGMVIIIDESEKEKALSILSSIGEKAYLIGEVVESETGVEICTK